MDERLISICQVLKNIQNSTYTIETARVHMVPFLIKPKYFDFIVEM
jgi:hypothetical protein